MKSIVLSFIVAIVLCATCVFGGKIPTTGDLNPPTQPQAATTTPTAGVGVNLADMNSNNVRTMPKSKSRVTIISNNNALKQVLPAPDSVDHALLEEQSQKAHKEDWRKKNDEEKQKTTQEDLKKKDAQAALDREKTGEENKKKEVQEAETKRVEAEQRKTTNEQNEKKQKQDEQKQKQDDEERKRKEKEERENNEKKREQETKQADEQKNKAAENERKQKQAVQLQNGWRNYGSGYQDPRYDRVNEFCFVSGLAAGDGGVIAQLNDDCRPKEGRLIFNLIKGNEDSRVDVLPDGRVYHIVAGGSSWLSLTGISFPVNRVSNLELQNGWVNYGYGYRETTQLNSNGLCMISGLIRSGAQGALARTESSCDPDGRLIFSCNNHERAVRVDVVSSTAYLITGANHGWVSLDGMAWVPRGLDQLNLLGDWQNYANGYRGASYKKTGNICVVSGLIKSASWNGPIATLPEGCRPSERIIFGVNVHTRSARVDVLPDGNIVYVWGKVYEWLSLDGIKFVVNN